MRAPRPIALLAALVLLVGVAACGDDDDDDDASATTAGATETSAGGSTSGSDAATTSAPGTDASSAAATGTPIVIGSIGCLTGPLSSTTTAAGPATEAWQSWVNDNGGINGHPVEVVLEDTACDPAQGQAKARELVEDRNVIAIVGMSDSGAPTPLAPYFEEQQVPVMSAYSTDPVWETSPVYFVLGQSYSSVSLSAVDMLAAAGTTKLALLVCAEFAACASTESIVQERSEATGVEYGGLLNISASQPDYSAECLRMKQDGVDGAIVFLTTASARTLMENCQQQDYDPTFYVCCATFDQTFIEIPVTVISNQQVLPWYVDDPRLADFNAAMEEYTGGPAEHPAALLQWAALELFRAAMADAPDGATREDVFAAMYALQGEDLGGLFPQPLTFTEGEPSPHVDCYYAASAEGGEFTTSLGLDPQCVS